jgi:transglutaminase-like putative cysteine protease
MADPLAQNPDDRLNNISPKPLFRQRKIEKSPAAAEPCGYLPVRSYALQRTTLASPTAFGSGIEPQAGPDMHIRYGYTIDISCERPTPLITMLDIHPSRRHDITEPDEMTVVSLADGARIGDVSLYEDKFGNLCRRFIAPAGGIRLAAAGIVHDSGFPDPVRPEAEAAPPEALPDDTLVYLLGSRYCETDRLSNHAWAMFGGISGGWNKVQAICDHVHGHLRFDYGSARPTRSAAEAYEERVGVCRDFAHLALTLCRCLNIPARYCTGYLGDIGVPPDPAPGDFSGWFEAFLGGEWWTFDARHNAPRIGRILIARGRDATDVPILNSFGAHSLDRFDIVTREVQGQHYPATSLHRRDHWVLAESLRAGGEAA